MIRAARPEEIALLPQIENGTDETLRASAWGQTA
jgi:hypothetical protein